MKLFDGDLYILIFWVTAIGSLIGRSMQALENGRPLDYVTGMVIWNLLIYVAVYALVWVLYNVRVARR